MTPNIQNSPEEEIIKAVSDPSFIKNEHKRRMFTANVVRILENLKRRRF